MNIFDVMPKQGRRPTELTGDDTRGRAAGSLVVEDTVDAAMLVA